MTTPDCLHIELLLVVMSYDNIGDVYGCPACHQDVKLMYDESYDEETETEDQTFWLEIVLPEKPS